jgi:hypothetical protein
MDELQRKVAGTCSDKGCTEHRKMPSHPSTCVIATDWQLSSPQNLSLHPHFIRKPRHCV